MDILDLGTEVREILSFVPPSATTPSVANNKFDSKQVSPRRLERSRHGAVFRVPFFQWCKTLSGVDQAIFTFCTQEKTSSGKLSCEFSPRKVLSWKIENMELPLSLCPSVSFSRFKIMSGVKKATSKHYRICVISDYFIIQYREHIKGSYLKVYPVFVTSGRYNMS